MDYESGNEDAASSLSDSTYDIISESSFRNSDEEGESDIRFDTESLVSFGDSSAAESVQDIEGEVEEVEVEGEQSNIRLHLPAADDSIHDDPTSSIANDASHRDSVPASEERDIDQQLTVPSLVLSSLSTIQPGSPPVENADSDLNTISMAQAAEWINFQEPVRVADGLFNMYRLKPATTPLERSVEISSEIPRLHTTTNVLQDNMIPTINLARLHYFGPKECKDEIVQHIAEALALSAKEDEDGTTTVNLVCISGFGHNRDDSDEIMLIPASQIRIQVLECDPDVQRQVYKRVPGTLDLAVHVVSAKGLYSDNNAGRLMAAASSTYPAIVLSDGPIPDQPYFDSLYRKYFPAGQSFILNGPTPAKLPLKSFEQTRGVEHSSTGKIYVPCSVEDFLNKSSPRMLNQQIALISRIPTASGPSLAWQAFDLIRSCLSALFMLYCTISFFSIYCLVSVVQTSYDFLKDRVIEPGRKYMTSLDSRVTPFVAKYNILETDGRRELLRIASMIGFLYLTLYGISGIQSNLARVLGKPANLEIPIEDFKQESTSAPGVKFALPVTSAQSVLPSSLTVPPHSSSDTSLSRVETQTGLSIIPSASKPKLKLFTSTPQFKLHSSGIDDNRLFLVTQKKLDLSMQFAFCHGPGYQMLDDPQLMRVNSTTIELHLPATFRCGHIKLIVWSEKSSRDKEEEFQINKPCPDIVPVTASPHSDWQRVIDQARVSFDRIVKQIRTLPLNWSQEVVPRIQDLGQMIKPAEKIENSLRALKEVTGQVGTTAIDLYKAQGETALTVYQSASTLAVNLYEQVKQERAMIRRRMQGFKIKSAEIKSKHRAAREKRKEERLNQRMIALLRQPKQSKAEKELVQMERLEQRKAKRTLDLARREAKAAKSLAKSEERLLLGGFLVRARSRAFKIAEKFNEGRYYVQGKAQQVELKESMIRARVELEELYDDAVAAVKEAKDQVQRAMGLAGW